MKTALVKVLVVMAGAVLFNIIFWHEKLAVKSDLFAWNMADEYVKKELFRSKYSRLTENYR